MKSVKFLIALLGISLSPLALANGFSQGEGFSNWVRSELVWNAKQGVYLVVPILKEDPFQERLVYSDHYADYVPFGMALRAAYDTMQRESQEQRLVWSDHYTDYVPSGMALGAAYDTMQRESQEQRLVWSDHYTDYVPGGMALRDSTKGSGQENEVRAFLAGVQSNPCPKAMAQPILLNLAARD